MSDPFAAKPGTGARRAQSRRRAEGRPAFPVPTTARRSTVDRPPVDASVGGRRPFTPAESDPAVGSNNAHLAPDAVNDLGTLHGSGEPVDDGEPVADGDAGVVDAAPGRCSSSCDEGHTYEAPCVMAGATVGEALAAGLAEGVEQASGQVAEHVAEAIAAATDADDEQPAEQVARYSTADVPAKADDVIAWLANAQSPDELAERGRAALEAEQKRKGKNRVTVVEAAKQAMDGGG